MVDELRRLYATELAALTALCRRLGEAGTPHAVDALSSTYWGLHAIGSSMVANYGSPDAAEALFIWFERKLKTRHRPNDWDPYHLLTVIRFAAKHDLHNEVALLLVKQRDQLSPEEFEWLERYWPGLFDPTSDPSAVNDITPPIGVGTHILDELSAPQTAEEQVTAQLENEKLEAESLTAAYQRARRRFDQQYPTREVTDT